MEVIKLLLNDLSNKVCVPNKIEDLNLGVSNMITGINELKALAKNIPCEFKCKFNGKKMLINVDVSVKNVIYVKKIIFGILIHVVVKIENI